MDRTLPHFCRRIACLAMIAALLIAGHLGPARGVAWADEDDVCPQRQFEVTTRREGNTTFFHVKNRWSMELTVTFRLELQGMVAEGPTEAVLPANSEKDLFRVVPTASTWKWKYRYHWVPGGPRGRHDDGAVYRLPYEEGTTHTVVQGNNGSYSHTGNMQYAIDFRMPVGTRVLAMRGGVVMAVESGKGEGGPSRVYEGCANYVFVRHADDTYASYQHFAKDGVAVRPGDRVRAGDLLGSSGNTGWSSGPHLHVLIFRAVDGYTLEGFPMRFRIFGQDQPVGLQQGMEYTATR